MKNPRKYGKAPFSVAVVHGGPGAAGELAPLARELAGEWGVLEPLQTSSTLAGQIEELHKLLQRNGNLPVALIGFSWGAWLAFILAARHPAVVKKLFLIGSGPFTEAYAAAVQRTRENRLTAQEKLQADSFANILADPLSSRGKNQALARFGALLTRADAFDPLPLEPEAVDCRADIFQRVWPEAAELRRSGKLLAFATGIACPLIAIHGDYDPHPADGVEKPLSGILRDFRFIRLEKCGHRPWIERHARERFFYILKEELRLPPAGAAPIY